MFRLLVVHNNNLLGFILFLMLIMSLDLMNFICLVDGLDNILSGLLHCLISLMRIILNGFNNVVSGIGGTIDDIPHLINSSLLIRNSIDQEDLSLLSRDGPLDNSLMDNLRSVVHMNNSLRPLLNDHFGSMSNID